jgi:hypothetical protein
MRQYRWLAALLLVAAAGCGRSLKYNDSVEGIVTLDSQPLGGVVVMFVPDENADLRPPSATATTDDDGHFKLTCENQHPGAVIGKHKVVVTRGRPADPGHRGEKPQAPLSKDQRPVPGPYSSAVKTPLQIEVTEDKHAGYDLVLKSSAQ